MSPKRGIALSIVMLLVAATAVRADGLGGGGPFPHADESSAAEFARIRAEVDAFYESRGPMPHGPGVPPLYPFFPMGGNLDHDIYTLNYNDLLAGTGIQDYMCLNNTYDGHNGSDNPIHSFLEQAIGIPFFAVGDGLIVVAHDGEPDMNTQPLGQTGNDIVLDLGAGRRVWYAHTKNGSVAVSAGEWVRAGQQLGMVGSSGNSTGPHLHFGSYNDGFTEYEPYAGGCRPGPSGWVNQPPFDTTPRLLDCSTTYIEPNTNNGGLPFDPTRSVQIALSDPTFYFWAIVENLPANANWRVRFRRPNGTFANDDTFPFNQPNFIRGGWFYWIWGTSIFGGVTGDWAFVLDFNGQPMVVAPFLVVNTRDQNFNRSPAPITVTFDPPNPKANQAVFCRVNTSNTLDDPDYDIVRYQYVWTVNGNVVRSNTFAGQADALPAYSAVGGDVVRCTVTASDGHGGSAPAVIASTIVSFSPPLVTVSVPATIRNAEYYVPNGTSYGDLFDPTEICFGKDNAGFSQTGLEFNLPVPRNATILSARIDFIATWDQNGAVTADIRAYNVGNAPPFDNLSPLPLSAYAPLTSPGVPWTAPTFVGDQFFSTPDLTSPTQQVVNRADWNAGQFIGFILDGTPTTPEAWRCMRFTGTNQPARLIVTYATTCTACDANCDGVTNGKDIRKFVDLLLAGGNGSCSACAADVNHDNVVGFADVAGFVSCLIP